MRVRRELGWVIRVEPWEWELLGCNRTAGREPVLGVLRDPPGCMCRRLCTATPWDPGLPMSPLCGSGCTCLTGVLYKPELINTHKATPHPWRRAKYHSCCSDLLGNAISLISESSQAASPFPSHRAAPLCTPPPHARGSRLGLSARAETAALQSAPPDHLSCPAPSLGLESSPVVTLLSH